VYLIIGLLGFFVTGFENFASETNETLLGFEINPLHNIVHVVIGAAGIALAPTLATAGPSAGCWSPATAWPSSTDCSPSATRTSTS
jgi:uncharacterized membrane protein YuzA (DUF378 family)